MNLTPDRRGGIVASENSKILTFSDLGGGVSNGVVAAHKIADNEARSMKNIASYDSPILETIYPSTQLGATFADSVDLLAVYGTGELCAVSNGSFYSWNGTAWSTALSTSVTGTVYSACNFMDQLIIGSGSTDGMKIYNGSVVSPASTDAPRAPYVTQTAGRVYAAGHNDYDIKFCALRDVTDWVTAGDAGAGTITIEAASGESNTGLGALTTGRIVVFKYTSFHELYGTGPINYQVADRYYGIGCAAHKTIVNINNWLYWMGIDGVYRWNGGIPQRISDKIKNLLPSLTIGSLSFDLCAGTDGRYYYLSLESNKIMAFDTYTGTWWGPWNYGEDAITFVDFMATVSKGFYMGTNSGKVLGLDNSAATGTVDFEWVSRSDFGNYLAKKESVSDLWLTAEVFTGAILNVYFSSRFKDAGDAGDWTLVKTISPGSLGTTRIQLPRISTHDFHRIKLSGSGKVNIYGIDKDVREV